MAQVNEDFDARPRMNSNENYISETAQDKSEGQPTQDTDKEKRSDSNTAPESDKIHGLPDEKLPPSRFSLPYTA